MKTFSYPPQPYCSLCLAALGWARGQEIKQVAEQGFVRYFHFPMFEKTCPNDGASITISLVSTDNN
jgi:tRNA(Arg) A34 adenosine deaminase TadA